jgi:hypothetical protein
MPDPHDAIVVLEQEIEALHEQAEGCRKLAFAARWIIVAGAATLLLLVLGAFGRSPGALVLGLGALVGGIALYGSNQGTLKRLRATIREREGQRAALIEASELRTVPT